MSVWVPKTIEDEVACLGMSADWLREVLRREVEQRCESRAWPVGRQSVRDVSFGLTETSEAAVGSWYHLTFILEEVPHADRRHFNVRGFHYHRVD